MDINAIVKSDTINEVKGEFRDFFIKRREALKLSVRELGEKAGVSYTVIYDMEKRSILPKVETLLKLSKALGLSTNVKHSTQENAEALGLVLYNNNSKCMDFILKADTKKPILTTDEQLRKLLNLKGLYVDDITEIEHFISFKLSQH